MKNELENIPGMEKIDWNKTEEVTLDEIPEQEVDKPEEKPEEKKVNVTGDIEDKKGESVDKPIENVETKFDISFFNKSFNTQFDSEDALKNALQSSSKAQELESKLSEYETLKSDIEYYKNGINPLDYFASEDDFRVQQFKIQHPDKDSSIAYKAFTSDLSKVDDLDVLVMYELVNDPGLKGGDAGAKEIIESDYGVSIEERDSWTTLQENKLRKAANLARTELKEMKDGIKLPENVNLNSKRETDLAAQIEKQAQSKMKWTATVDNMFSNMDKVPIYDVDADGKQVELLSYVMDDKSKTFLKQNITDYVVNSNKDITEESVKEAGQIVYSRFILDNLPKIIKSYATDLLSKQEKVIDEKIHNAEKVTMAVKPEGEVEKEKAAFIDFALGGEKGFKRNPLF
jgi:hypothetical protein